MPLSGDPVYGALAPEVHPRQPLLAPDRPVAPSAASPSVQQPTSSRAPAAVTPPRDVPPLARLGAPTTEPGLPPGWKLSRPTSWRPTLQAHVPTGLLGVWPSIRPAAKGFVDPRSVPAILGKPPPQSPPPQAAPDETSAEPEWNTLAKENLGYWQGAIEAIGVTSSGEPVTFRL